MKKHLTKVYNIFKQIESLNGNVGWDQTGVFYFFYETSDFDKCYQLIYGLFAENKQLDLKKFGLDLNLSSLAKLADYKSSIYEFGNSEEPILVALMMRSKSHKISGTTMVTDPVTDEHLKLEFVDGIKVDEEIVDEDEFNESVIVALNSQYENGPLEGTTTEQMLAYFTELKSDFQFDPTSDGFLGFINIDPNDILEPTYDILHYIINNTDEAELIANQVGLTIETANSDEFIVNLMDNNDIGDIMSFI